MSVDPTSRCVLHPGRVAVDRCPVCDRGRCAQDAAAHGALGCGICLSQSPQRAPASTLQLVVSAALASMPAAFVGGPIASEYVSDHIFSLVVPALVGVAACWPALVVVQRGGRTGRQLRALTLVASGCAAICAVLGTALGFRLDPGGPPQIVSPLSLVGGPYLSAALAGLLWPYLYGGPKRSNPDV